MNKKIFLDSCVAANLQKQHGFQVLWVRLFMAFFTLADGKAEDLSTSLVKAAACSGWRKITHRQCSSRCFVCKSTGFC